MEQDHQEHVNIDEVHQQYQSNIQNEMTILSSNVNMLNNDQQRIRGELCSNQCSLRIVSEELSLVRSSSEDNVSFANGMTIINDFLLQEIWSLKQMVENNILTSFDGTFLWKITCAKEKIGMYFPEIHRINKPLKLMKNN